MKEMKALQIASMFVSTKAHEKECEEFLSDQVNQVWRGMSEEWQDDLTEKEESLAL